MHPLQTENWTTRTIKLLKRSHTQSHTQQGNIAVAQKKLIESTVPDRMKSDCGSGSIGI